MIAFNNLKQSKGVPAQNIMYTSLFDTIIAECVSPMKTVYVVSDSQIEEIKHKQRQE